MEITKIQLDYTAEEHLELPPYKGSTFRGGFGHVYKRVSCLNSTYQCEGCDLTAQCSYFKLFHTRKDTKSPIPPPYVIEPPLSQKTRYHPGDPLSFRFVAFGEYTRHLPYYLYAFELLGRQGVGKGRRSMHLKQAESLGPNSERKVLYDDESQSVGSEAYYIDWEDLPAEAVQEVTLHLYTPLQIQHKGKLVQGPVPFSLLMKNILRRWKMLSEFHGSESEVEKIAKWENKEPPMVQIADFDVDWHVIKRWSNRQQQKHPLMGMTGSIRYQGDLTEWIPLLKLGALIHVGKKTSFGLGQYELEYKTA